MGRIWWFRPPGGKRESSGSVRKEDAENMLQARLDELRLGKSQAATDATRTTYEDLEQLLLADLKANRRRSAESVEKYGVRHLRQFFGGMPAGRIGYDVVTGYVARRLDQAKPATVLYEVKLLRRMLRLALRAKRVGAVPDFPTVSVGDNARKGFCSPEDIDRVIAHLPEHARPVVRAMYLTGWRTGEVLGLEWRRVDFEAGTLRLDAEHSKSGKPRTFPFGQLPALRAVLREQWARTQALQRKRGAVIPYVFHLGGEPLGSFRTAWRSAVRKAGLPGLRPHDMRRSAARNLVRAGVPEGVVMKLCGWTTRHMFDRYNVSDEQDLKDGVERLKGFLAQKRRRVAAKG